MLQFGFVIPCYFFWGGVGSDLFLPCLAGPSANGFTVIIICCHHRQKPVPALAALAALAVCLNGNSLIN